ncbi:Phospholipid scramblase [Quillaja saponaria]|uniref:Phospholipid scramblase n=1 Tax=Quillaja saponaria TaxID=32244 RepID=A0AAD7M5G0_QUISA|nr:Phospholipid scramblase [Quillaja saponaria]
MGNKPVLEDRGRVKCLHVKHSNNEARHARTYSSLGLLSSKGQDPKYSDKLIEFSCSTCLLCVCCPLALVWSCIKQPCKFCQQAMKHAGNWACCRARNKVFATYSSFSDIDWHDTFDKEHPASKNGSSFYG